MGLDRSPQRKNNSVDLNNASNCNCIPQLDQHHPAIQFLLEAIKSSENNLNSKLDSVLDRLTTLEQRSTTMETRIHDLEKKSTDVLDDLLDNKQNTDALRAEVHDKVSQLKEENDRSWRRNNVIFKGIPENEAANQLITSLIAFLLPNHTLNISHERVGKTKSLYPRPVRVYLPNKAEKSELLRNCKNLKGQDMFQSISVCPDWTKQQQEQRRTPVKTRSQTTAVNDRKRPRMDNRSIPSVANPTGNGSASLVLDPMEQN